MKSEIERFAKDVAQSSTLRDQVKAVGTDPRAMVEFANGKGYHFSLDDVNALAGSSDELTDSDLGTVAGGTAILFGGEKSVIPYVGAPIIYASRGRMFVLF